jgi:3-oxoacyl-[acyl-carrier protein] reductase
VAKPLRTSEARQVRRNPNYGYAITPCRQFLGFTSNLSDQHWLKRWDVNVRGRFYCTSEALKFMEPQVAVRAPCLVHVAARLPKIAHGLG